MAQIQDQKFADLGLQKSVSEKGIVSYHRSLTKTTKGDPILVLLHGYPQSAYMYETLSTQTNLGITEQTKQMA